jgi:hypothetical protein
VGQAGARPTAAFGAASEAVLSVEVASLLSAPFIVTLRGYVLMTLWGWFAVPLGARPLLLWHACGVSLLAGYLTFQMDTAKELRSEDAQHNVRVLWTAWLTPPAVLAFGALFVWLGGAR